MGYVRNHAIIVTSTYGDHIDRAHAEAVRIFPWVSPISPIGMNGTRSFFIPPDGSKEGWKDSEEGDMRRDEFKAYCRSQAYGDGSSPLHWAELTYGGDDARAEIQDSSNSPVQAQTKEVSMVK